MSPRREDFDVGAAARVDEVPGGFRAVLIVWPDSPEHREEFQSSITTTTREESERIAREAGVWLLDNWARIAGRGPGPKAPDGAA